MPLDVPVVFCIFNRPNETQKVFDEIARQKPTQLLVVADGPREHVPQDMEQVLLTRAVIDRIDWPCNLQCNYAKSNLGCRVRMGSGISWAFQQVEEAIILEDDCLPHPSFFDYCRDLLDRYRDEEKVMMISGDNFQPQRRTANSYYFSRWPHIWGWASWRRAWQHFDDSMSDWPEHRNRLEFRRSFESTEEFEYWSEIFDGLAAGTVDTWDFAWTYACWKQRGLTILPETNLVSNLGFGATATHTTDSESSLASLPTGDIGDLQHPEKITRHQAADRFTYETIFLPEITRQRTARQVVPRQKKRFWERWFRRRAA